MINDTKLAAVIGWPVHQSISPLLHSHWLKEHGIKGSYVPLPIAPENFERCIDALPLMGFVGANVTVPHKEAAFRLATTRDQDAEATRAVNTLIFEGGNVAGLNTDVRGFAASLAEELGPAAMRLGPVVVLGAGGAARAIAHALTRGGAPEIRIANRTKVRAEALAGALETRAVKIVEWGDWKTLLRDSRLLINTTSLGMTGKARLEIDLAALPADAAVADIVYNPFKTELLRTAREHGHRTMDGLGMLMHQAVHAFAAWFGVTPKVTPELRATLIEALGG